MTGNVLRIIEESFKNKVFVRVRRICGYARSTRLINAAQIRSKMKTFFRVCNIVKFLKSIHDDLTLKKF